MAITSILRNFVGDPNTVTIVTDDTLATITTAGYVTAQATNIELLNNGEFQWQDTDIVLISYASGIAFFTYDSVNADFIANPVAGSKPAYVVVFAGKESYAGGSATDAITVTGALDTDLVFAQVQESTTAVSVQKVTPTANTLTVLMSADPGAATVITWQVLRLAA